jgi:hypothetical protein
VKYNGDPRKKRKWLQIPGISSEHSFGVHNANVVNVERALQERYFNCEVSPGVFQPPLPTSTLEWEELHPFRKEFLRHVSSVQVYSRQEVVDMYTGGKRRVYEAALRELQRIGDVKPFHSRLNTFTKFEKANIAKAPRVIQPRTPMYNLELARYLKKFEKIAFKSIAKVFGEGPTVIKGMNAVASAAALKRKWDHFDDPVGIGLDAKKFDMHVTPAALEYEHSFYNKCFHSRKLAALLRHQLENDGRAYCPDGDVSFHVVGTRSSGDINTSLGNCIIMCALIWTWSKRACVDVQLANNGDDCVVFMERADKERFVQGLENWFETKGFRMTVEKPVAYFEQIEFCQSRPVFNGVDYVMTRNLSTTLQKDAMCLVPVQTTTVLQKWFTAVGQGGLALNSGVPVFQSFYNAYLRAGGGKCSQKFTEHIRRGTNVALRVHGLDATKRRIVPESRLSFYIAFGITPDRQVCLEKYYDEWTLSTLEPSPVMFTEKEDLFDKPSHLFHEYV